MKIMVIVAALSIIGMASSQAQQCSTAPASCKTSIPPLNDGSDLDKAIAICNSHALGLQMWNSEVQDQCAAVLQKWKESEIPKQRQNDKLLLEKLVK